MILGIEQEKKIKMSLKHLVGSESKEVLKDRKGGDVKDSQEPT